MTMASTTRLASLDVLRGFDMLFIMGGEGLVSAVAAALEYFHGVWYAEQNSAELAEWCAK